MNIDYCISITFTFLSYHLHLAVHVGEGILTFILKCSVVCMSNPVTCSAQKCDFINICDYILYYYITSVILRNVVSKPDTTVRHLLTLTNPN